MKPNLASARPYAPAFFLVLAFTLGGLRAPLPWLAFGVVFLAWFAARSAVRSFSSNLAAGFFFLWLGAAAFFSPEPAASLAVLSHYAVLGLLFFSVSAEGSGEKAWLGAVTLLGGVCAGVLVFQRAFSPTPAGLLGLNPNYSAVFCAAAFPAVLLAVTGPGGRKEKVLYFLLALLLAGGLLASGSRGALLAAFTAAAVGLGALRRWRSLAGLGVIALALAAFLPASVWESLLKVADPRAFERPHIWSSALKAAAASPLLGWGPGLFGEVFERFKFPYFDGISFYGHSTLHAHSEVLNLAAEAGFPAAVLFLAAAGTALFTGGVRKLPLKLCALAALIQGGADMIFYSGAVSLLFWGSLGFSSESASAENLSRRLKGAVAALCLGGLVLGAVRLYVPGGEERFLEVSGAEYEAGGGQALGLALRRHSALNNPKNAFVAEAEGRALAAAGNWRAAEAAFRRALELEPFFARAHMGLAGVYGAAGRAAEGCGELALAARPPGAAPHNEYQLALVLQDGAAFDRLNKDLCVKKRTGSATAPGRKTH